VYRNFPSVRHGSNQQYNPPIIFIVYGNVMHSYTNGSR
jgi:hypothetical protein